MSAAATKKLSLSDLQCLFIVEYFQSRKDILLNKSNRASVSRMKRAAWTEIAGHFNNKFPYNQRNWRKIKKKWENMVAVARKWAASQRLSLEQPDTFPPVSDPPSYIKTIVDILDEAETYKDAGFHLSASSFMETDAYSAISAVGVDGEMPSPAVSSESRVKLEPSQGPIPEQIQLPVTANAPSDPDLPDTAMPPSVAGSPAPAGVAHPQISNVYYSIPADEKDSVESLKKEVLLLEKEKLGLEITKLRMEIQHLEEKRMKTSMEIAELLKRKRGEAGESSQPIDMK